MGNEFSLPWNQHLTDLDPRLNAYRPDLADVALRGQVKAKDYAKGEPGRVSVGRLPLMNAPDNRGEMISELLFGEEVTIFDVRDGWAWLQSREDDYVGYARIEGLDEPSGPPTHRVSALRTFLYEQPDLKSPVLETVSMNSPLSAGTMENDFLRLDAGGWIWAAHVAASDEYEHDHATVALRFLEAPYLWGGRSSIGLDCSGLIQMALARCGMVSPRDSDMQAGIGVAIPFDGDEAILAHGDLVFWPGHVGIWLEGGDFVHANASDMKVARGCFNTIADRIVSTTGDKVTAVRRV